MTVTAQTIVTLGRTLSNDEDSADYRWSDADWLSFLNAAQRDICTRVLSLNLKPAYLIREVIELAAGSQQSLTACNAGSGTDLTGINILKVVRNVGVTWVNTTTYAVSEIVYDTANDGVYKSATAHTAAGTAPASDSTNWTATSEDRQPDIESIHQANLDTLLPNWRHANTDDTGTDGVLVQYWMEDNFDDETFHVYPQQPDSSYKMNVEIIYAGYPANISTISSNIVLGDNYQEALLEYALHMAYAVDDEVDVNGNTRSDKWYSKYLANPIFR